RYKGTLPKEIWDIVRFYLYQLNTTRRLIEEKEKKKIYDSIIEILGLISSDPEKIWKIHNKHVYVSKFKFGKNKRIVMFVAEQDGRLITAYQRSPKFRKNKKTYIIYS
ncbi:hypothetical protein DRJ16_02285, partial [Candidatus Woesearchaeota archaeon]